MKKAEKMPVEFKKVLFCALVERNKAIDDYRKAVRTYCLTSENWDEVEQAREEAHWNGINDDQLLEINIEVQNSITDEELMKAIYG